MKVIIAGGRDYLLSDDDYGIIETLHEENNFTEIVSGKARGVDTCGEVFAEEFNIPVKEFPAKWNDVNSEPCLIKLNPYGKPYNALAGFARNQKMAEYADAIILFKGGKGTNDMRKRAKKQGLVFLYDGGS